MTRLMTAPPLAIAPQRVQVHDLLAPSRSSLVVHLRLPPGAAAAVGPTKADATPDTSKRSSDSDSESTDAGASSPRRWSQKNSAPKKRRKPTSTVRKEEKQALLFELAELEAKAERLRERVGLPSLMEDRSLESAQSAHCEMEHVRRGQLLGLCEGQTMLAQYMREQFAGPLKMPIVLGRDPMQRRATLLALHQPKLEVARQYLESRLAGVDETTPFSDYQSWTAANGDFCFHRSDITQFEGVGSVKNVFDALVFYMSNMEIAISEQLGQLTLREDIDAVDTRISNHRIVSSTHHGVVVEVNSVTNSEFFTAHDGGNDFALLTNDSVDVDELYPYCPESRMHRTIHAAVSLRSFRKPSPTGDGELVVVQRRCAYLSIKKPQFHVSDEALDELRESVSAWGGVMLKAVGDRARTLAVCDSTRNAA